MATLLAALAAHSLAVSCNCAGTDCRLPAACKTAVEVTAAGVAVNALGTPSSALTLTFLHNRVPAWADLVGSELKNPPTEVTGIPTFVPSAVLGAGSEVVFHCPATAGDVCDAWVFFYNCPQSCTVAYQGEVPSLLAADSWEHTICAPRFVTGVPSGYAHQMRSYRKKVAPGTSASFTTTKNAEFLAFGLDTDGVDCSKRSDEKTCNAAARSMCSWSAVTGECLATRCKRGGQGPPPPCTECPWNVLVKRPLSDGPF